MKQIRRADALLSWNSRGGVWSPVASKVLEATQFILSYPQIVVGSLFTASAEGTRSFTKGSPVLAQIPCSPTECIVINPVTWMVTFWLLHVFSTCFAFTQTLLGLFMEASAGFWLYEETYYFLTGSKMTWSKVISNCLIFKAEILSFCLFFKR